MESNLKTRTAGAVKWNLIDRFGSQLLYAVTGIVLARVLTQEDFGLVGAVLVFQAFASLLVDSGFSYALIQRKDPSRLDYSSVLWFNLGVATLAYALLWVCAPLVADCFGGDPRLVPLSRLMFVCLIINASSIVQVNRLVKRMHVRPVAVANGLGLFAGAIVGIWLALAGYGAWAIVWQNIVSGTVKSLYLWATSRWLPVMACSLKALRSFFRVGGNMMLTSFLNTVFLNIYSLLVGNRAGLVSLGYYTQSDKWSKMGTATLAQVFTSSFLPVLSAVQDQPERLHRTMNKMDRATAYLTLPTLCGLMVLATPVFHVLFGAKWDPSIVLFQLLLFRGIFTVFCQLYNNYLLACGHSRTIVWLEVLRDAVAIAALVATFPVIAESRPADPVWGLRIMLWGQVAATLVTWGATLVVVAVRCGHSVRSMLGNALPYVAITLVACAAASLAMYFCPGDLARLVVGAVVGLGVYMGGNTLLGSRIQADVLAYLRGRPMKFEEDCP